MGKTYRSGIGTTADRRSPIAPTSTAPGMPQGIYAGAKAPERGTLRLKGGAKSGEPAGANKANRAGVLERHGARHRIVVPRMPAQSPQAHSTQANGRVIPSFPKMQDAWGGQGFWDASRGGM